MGQGRQQNAEALTADFAEWLKANKDQLAALSSLPPAAGNTHNDAQMRMMER